MKNSIYRVHTLLGTKPLVLVLVALLAATALPANAQELPKRPEELVFPKLSFEPPEAASHRKVLKNGVVVFLMRSTELPLIDVTFTFKGGRYLETQAGLGAAMASLLRTGGTKTVGAAEFDERLAALAANVSVNQTDYRTVANLNTLKGNLHQSFMLFIEMLRSPRFEADRFKLYKDEVLEGLKQRNDRAEGIQRRVWTRLIYGEDHFKSKLTTNASLDALTVETLRTIHQQIVQPGNLVISVKGDFDEKALMDRLEKVMAGWTSAERVKDAPGPTSEIVPGLYRVEKDIPQGRVFIGLRGIKHDDPDAFALSLMSRVLGSSGFSSRITQRVRSDEGLAYSAGAFAIPGLYFRGEFRAFFESKNRTVALATKIIMEEIVKIRTEPVTAEELEAAKASSIESFPESFASKSATLGVFVEDELTAKDANYWRTYRSKVQAVTKEDVLAVAKKYLVPEKMMILVVGKWSEIEAGDLEGRAKMSEFFSGKSTQLPLRDPLTLEPIK